MIWQYGLWSLKMGDTKLERFLLKNRYTQRKLLNFEFWINYQQILRLDLKIVAFTYIVEACSTNFESIIIFSCNTIICSRLELLFSKRFFNSSIQFSNFPNNISSRFDELWVSITCLLIWLISASIFLKGQIQTIYDQGSETLLSNQQGFGSGCFGRIRIRLSKYGRIQIWLLK